MRLGNLRSVALILLLTFSTCFAHGPLQTASPEELIEKLKPSSESAGQTRGLRNLVPIENQAPAVDLSIQFEFDSAKLIPSSIPILLNLVKAINSQSLISYGFLIEGHADATGSPEYNLRLSRRRAETVLIFLSQNGVDRKRLKATGKGSTEPFLPSQPNAEVNRRVRILNNL
jgi:outer membrane protein OmpA-like peptidoglycan-associated protein